VFSLGELAERLQLTLEGDADAVIRGLSTLGSAGPDELAFLANDKHLADLAQCCAGAVILRPEARAATDLPCLLSSDPYLSYAQASQLLDQRPRRPAGVHHAAVVADSAILGSEVSIGPGACIEPGVSIGDRTVIGAGVFVGEGSCLGADTLIHANTTLYDGVVIGSHCIIHSQTAIGSDGFGYAPSTEGWQKIHQLGGVVIGDRVEIGAGCTIDRGALDDTVIEDGVIIDNQVHIAHNCRIGKNTAIAGCVGIAGSSTIGANCTMAGQVGIAGHLTICDNVHLGGQARVTRSIDQPGTYTSGTLLTPLSEWTRNASRFTKLDRLFRRVTNLEKNQQKGDK